MDKFDKELYKALRFFSEHNVNEIDNILENNPQMYRHNVAKKIEAFISFAGYLQTERKELLAINKEGITEFRILNNIEHKEKTRIASWVAIIASSMLSVVALVISILSLYLKSGGN